MSTLVFVISSIFALLSAGALGVGAEPRTVDLKPKFVVGQEDRFMVEMNSARQAKFVDSNVNRPESYRQKLRVKRRVLETGEAGAKLELVYEAAEIAIAAGNKSVGYDSEGINDSESELTVGTAVEPALNKPIIVEVDPLGRVKRVSGNANAPGVPPALSLLGDEMFTRTFVPLYGSGADVASAAVGHTWIEERQSPAAQTGVVTTLRRFTLDEANDRTAKIGISGSLSLEPSEKAAAAKTRIDSSAVTGSMTWSLEIGCVKEYVYRQEMKLMAETDGRERVALTEYSLVISRIEVWPPEGAAKQETTGLK
ncbi:MAG: hypothetical protein ACK4WH_01995 [Phycisphaerales bacterium]